MIKQCSWHSFNTSMAMDGYFALFGGELEDAHHIEQSADGSDAVIVPAEVVVEDSIVHKQLRIV